MASTRCGGCGTVIVYEPDSTKSAVHCLTCGTDVPVNALVPLRLTRTRTVPDSTASFDTDMPRPSRRQREQSQVFALFLGIALLVAVGATVWITLTSKSVRVAKPAPPAIAERTPADPARAVPRRKRSKATSPPRRSPQAERDDAPIAQSANQTDWPEPDHDFSPAIPEAANPIPVEAKNPPQDFILFPDGHKIARADFAWDPATIEELARSTMLKFQSLPDNSAPFTLADVKGPHAFFSWVKSDLEGFCLGLDRTTRNILYLGEYRAGKRDGAWLLVSDDSQPRAMVEYRGGRAHGLAFLYGPTGDVDAIVEFSRGTAVASWTIDAEGNAIVATAQEAAKANSRERIEEIVQEISEWAITAQNAFKKEQEDRRLALAAKKSVLARELILKDIRRRDEESQRAVSEFLTQRANERAQGIRAIDGLRTP